MNEMMVLGRLEAMLRDPYANYVVQTALDVANPAQKESVRGVFLKGIPGWGLQLDSCLLESQMIHRILPVMPFIRATPHGKRLQAKLNAEDTLLFAPSPVYLRAPLTHQLGSAFDQFLF